MKSEPAMGPLGTDLIIPQPGSPIRTADWLGSDFANGFFDSADDLDLPSTLSGEDERLLAALNDGSSFGFSSSDDFIDAASDREMIMSEAAAAGIHRSGMRRHAFSTGDLQALQPDPDEAPLSLGPPPPSVLRMGSISLRTPRLESVPEGSVTHLTSTGALDSTRTSTAEQLSCMSMSQLQAELDQSRAAYQSATAPSVLTALEATRGHAFQSGCLTDSVPVSNIQGFGEARVQHERYPDNDPMELPGTQPSVGPAPMHRPMGRSQSALELHHMGSISHAGSSNDLRQLEQVTVELMTPEGHIYRVGRLSAAERAQKILKYRQKRHERNFTKRIKYQCRKTLADSRPRVRGRFARNDDAGAVLPHESKKALAAKKGRPGRHVHVQTASEFRLSVEGVSHKTEARRDVPKASAMLPTFGAGASDGQWIASAHH